MIEKLFGKSLAHWDNIMHVMETNGIDTPEQLRDRLRGTGKRVLTVVDAGNKDRVLGIFVNPPPSFNGNYLRVCVMPRTSCVAAYSNMDAIQTMRVDTVDFALGWRTSADGYDRHAILTTTSPLETLMSLREFRLPGESERQAHERLYRY